MVGSVFWWCCSCRFCEIVRDGRFWVLCVSVLVCLCGCVCVYQRKKKMMRKRRSMSWFRR